MYAPKSIATMFILAAVVALGPMSTDMYLPALPRIATELEASTASVQLTLSLFLVGFAIAQLFYGPLSDRYGRKPVMVGGLIVFIIASIGCALVENINALMFFRLLQALGGSAGPVLGRAIVRDIYGAKESGRVLSHIASIMALAPAFAPILGGFFAATLGWHAIFWFLVAYGIIGVVLFSLKVKESAPAAHHQPKSLATIRQHYLQLLADRDYVGYVLACSFSYAGLFAFLSGVSFVLVGQYGVSEQQFGLYFMLIVVGYVVGTQISAKVGQFHSHQRLIMVGGLLLLAASGLMIVLVRLENANVASVIVPMMVFMIGVGIVMPQSMAGALKNYPNIAGTASGLLGFVQMSIAGLAGIVVGHSYNSSATPMSIVIFLMAAFCLLSSTFLIKGNAAKIY